MAIFNSYVSLPEGNPISQHLMQGDEVDPDSAAEASDSGDFVLVIFTRGYWMVYGYGLSMEPKLNN